MKKIVALCLLIILSISVQIMSVGAVDVFDVPENISVNDYSKVITESTKSYINSSNEMLLGMTGSKIIFVTVPTTNEEPIDEYANRLYRTWGVSSIGDCSSTFVVLATDDMEYWSVVGTHLSSALTRETMEELLLTYMEPDFAQRNFDSAVKTTFIAISDWYTGHYNTSVLNAKNKDEDIANEEESSGGGAFWGFLKILFLLALTLGIGYIIIRRNLRLRAIQMRKNQRLQNYRKAGRYSSGSDYEYFEFYDTSDE